MYLPNTRIFEISCTSCTTSNLVDSHETAFCRKCRAQVCHSVSGNWFRLRQIVWFDSTKSNQLYQGTIVSIKYDSNDSTEAPGTFLPVRIKYLDTNWSADKYDEFKSFDKLYVEAPGRESRRGDTLTKLPISSAPAAVSVTASINQPTANNPPTKKRRVNPSIAKPAVKSDVKSDVKTDVKTDVKHIVKPVENQSSIPVANQPDVESMFALLLDDPTHSLFPEEPTAQEVAVATNAVDGERGD